MKNGKFEVGDIVAGKENPRIPYSFTNHQMRRARVTAVEGRDMNVEILSHTDKASVGRKFWVENDPGTFELVGIAGDDYPDRAALVITRNGAELTANLAADGKLASAKAVCSPHDAFSIHAGIGLLLERLGFPKPEETAEPEPYKPQVGDLVRITNLNRNADNGGLRVGDLARIVAFYRTNQELLYVSCPKKSCYIGDSADRRVSGHVMLLNSDMYELIERQPDRW